MELSTDTIFDGPTRPMTVFDSRERRPQVEAYIVGARHWNAPSMCCRGSEEYEY